MAPFSAFHVLYGLLLLLRWQGGCGIAGAYRGSFFVILTCGLGLTKYVSGRLSIYGKATSIYGQSNKSKGVFEHLNARMALPSLGPILPPIAPGSTQEPSSFTLRMSLSTAKSAYPPPYSIWYDKEDDIDLLSVHPSEDGLLRSHNALSYARRPSSTNKHSTIPLITCLRAQRRVVQDTVQTPRKKTLRYLDQVPLPIITAGIHMGLLHALQQHLWPPPISWRVTVLPLPESRTVLLSLHTFHFSLLVRHIQRLPQPCHLRGLLHIVDNRRGS